MKGQEYKHCICHAARTRQVLRRGSWHINWTLNMLTCAAAGGRPEPHWPVGTIVRMCAGSSLSPAQRSNCGRQSSMQGLHFGITEGKQVYPTGKVRQGEAKPQLPMKAWWWSGAIKKEEGRTGDETTCPQWGASRGGWGTGKSQAKQRDETAGSLGGVTDPTGAYQHMPALWCKQA
eukprot:362936-Chlamydomonas_euryale.AAC.5